jgi:hypothetical protein
MISCQCSTGSWEAVERERVAWARVEAEEQVEQALQL